MLIATSLVAPPLLQSVVVAVAGAVGGIGIFRGLCIHRPRRPLAWRVLAVGTVLISLPRMAEQLVLHELAPRLVLDVGNALGGLGFVGVVLGPALLARARSRAGDREGLIDGAILSLALATALQQWLTAMRSGGFMQVPASALGVMTIISAVALAAGIRLLFLAPNALAARLVAFATLSSVLIGVAGVASEGGQVADAVFILATMAALANGAAALSPSMRTLTEPSEGAHRAPFSRLVVLGVALFAPLVAVLNEAGVTVHTSFAAASSILVTGLVFVRILRLVHDRERVRAALDSREAQQALVARLGEQALVEADMDSLVEQVIAELPATVDAETVAVLRSEPTTATFHVHGAVHWPDSMPDPVPAPPALNGDGPGTRTNAPIDWQLPHLDAGHTVAVPLVVSQDVVGVLIAHRGRDAPFTADERTCLQSVASVLSSGIHRLRSQAEMRRQALHDVLTDLPNRTLLVQRLQQSLDEVGDDSLGVLFIDLDGFKTVNDTLGHQAGDQLLTQVAERLGAQLQEGDTLARISGDEFVLVCRRADAQHVEIVAERVVETCAKPFALTAGSAPVGVSVGVVMAACDQTPEELLQYADIAMYRSKQTRGTSSYTVFDEQLRADVAWVRDVERCIVGAAERGELELVWQPIVSVADGRWVAAEALARWTHPDLGAVGPDQFIPIAERVGAIGSVGRWVLDEACRQVARWRSIADDQFVGFVNVSARQLAVHGFAAHVLDRLDDAGLPPTALGLEVTETAAMEDPQRTRDALTTLRADGVRIALDDFGSGHSSLSYLQQLPVDIVKVDKTLVRQLAPESATEAIMASIVAISEALACSVIAEGVERPARLTAVRRLGCHLAQGFHLARPMPAAMLADRLRAQAGAPVESVVRPLAPTTSSRAG